MYDFSILEWFDTDNLTDYLLAAASEEYEKTALTQAPSSPSYSSNVEGEAARANATTTTSPASQSNTERPTLQPTASRVDATASPFGNPKTTEEILEARRQGIPLRTQQDTQYCIRLWEEWRNYRQTATNENISPLIELDNAELDNWLTCFVLEVRKKDGSLYPPNTLHHIIAGLLRHMRENGRNIDLFNDPGFASFRASLDAEMKRISGAGIGSKKRQAEIITEEEEELLWGKGVLGDETPQSLLATMVFYNGLYFALRSGQEHRQLRRKPCQIEVVERKGERPYLVYTEDLSKNRPGGLKGRNTTPKVVKHHANLEVPKRCFVRLFKKYQSLCPPDAPESAFYLQPARSPSSSCWYSKRPLGHNTLAKTVPRMCQSAGIQGYKTNHSLRATSTSRLYHSGVDEQPVMERTGHRSIDGVRSYKRTSESQKEALSDILNRKAPRIQDSNPVVHSVQPTSLSHSLPVPTQNIIQASAHSQFQGLNLSSAAFSSCTINFNISNTPH